MRIGLSSDDVLYTYDGKQTRSENNRRMELKGTHWDPVIPRPALTTDAVGCRASIGVGGNERLALYLHRVADIGLVVVILGDHLLFSIATTERNETYPLCTREWNGDVHQWFDDLVYEMSRVLLEGIWSEESVVAMNYKTASGSLSPVIKSPSMTLL
jgi:hypothetical protein